MANILKELESKELILPPGWLSDNTHYLTLMGSIAYGVSSDTSDCDVYGFVIPPKEELFPHLRGEIYGFGNAKNGNNRFRNYQQHHIKYNEKSYDLSIFNIVDYFQLCMENNPNMLDSLFTPDHSILQTSRIAQIVRQNRTLFLSKKCFHTFKGYAYQQIKKADNTGKDCEAVQNLRQFEANRNLSHSITFQEVHEEYQIRKNCGHRNDKFKDLSDDEINFYYNAYHYGMNNTKRFEGRKIYNVDLKFLYHTVRVADECEQILMNGDLDLQRNKEHLKAIRRGDIPVQEIKDWFSQKEKFLEKLYEESKLPYCPDEKAIKTLLLNCLEEHYGNLNCCIHVPDKLQQALQDIQRIVQSTL